MTQPGDPNGTGRRRARGHITLEIAANGQAVHFGEARSDATSWMLLVPTELIDNGALPRLVERALRDGQPTQATRIDVAAREPRTWFANTVPQEHGGLLLELVDITDSVSSVRRAERERGLLILGQFAHQFRNPLAGMLGAMQVFEADLPKDSASAVMAEAMIAQGFHLNRLVSDLVLIAREPDVRVESFSMRDAVEAVVEAIDPTPATPVRIEGTSVWQSDKALFTRILKELIQNAVDATVDGGTVEVSIDDTQIIVSDSGAGVAPEHIAEMFEPMFGTQPHRLGLGLAVAERFCRALELTLDYERRGNPQRTLFVVTAKEPVTLHAVP